MLQQGRYTSLFGVSDRVGHHLAYHRYLEFKNTLNSNTGIIEVYQPSQIRSQKLSGSNVFWRSDDRSRSVISESVSSCKGCVARRTKLSADVDASH